jgi:hypothetical protein
LIGLTFSAKAQLDLRPHYFKAGGIIGRAYFADGDKKYAVTLDSETQLSEADGGALFRFTNVPQATMLLRHTPLDKLLPFDTASLTIYLKAAKALLPQGSEDAILEAQIANPLPINQWRSYRFVLSYTIANSQMRDSFTFLNLTDGQQILVQTTARLNFFKAISERADDIIRRWHEVLPGSENEVN